MASQTWRPHPLGTRQPNTGSKCLIWLLSEALPHMGSNDFSKSHCLTWKKGNSENKLTIFKRKEIKERKKAKLLPSFFSNVPDRRASKLTTSGGSWGFGASSSRRPQERILRPVHLVIVARVDHLLLSRSWQCWWFAAEGREPHGASHSHRTSAWSMWTSRKETWCSNILAKASSWYTLHTFPSFFT